MEGLAIQVKEAERDEVGPQGLAIEDENCMLLVATLFADDEADEGMLVLVLLVAPEELPPLTLLPPQYRRRNKHSGQWLNG